MAGAISAYPGKVEGEKLLAEIDGPTRLGGFRALPFPSRRTRLIAAMVISVGVIAGLALLDQKLASDAALRDYAHEQRLLAEVAARSIELQTRGSASGSVDAEALERSLARLFPRSHHTVPSHATALLLPPNRDVFLDTSGRRFVSAPLLSASRSHAAWVRLEPSESQAIGLPKRTALAGMASMKLDTGTWTVAVVASAARERDRAKHAQWRFLGSVVLAAGVVIAFGTAALRTLRARLELERALDRASLREERNAQLARESRAVTMLTLAAGVAHEVATPLNVITGRAEQLLTATGAQERVVRNARAIVDQSQRIREVVRGFLDLARGQAPVLVAVQPQAMVKTAVGLVGHRFDERGVTLSPSTPNHLPNVHGERRLLEQALVNLLLNACDACARGGHVALSAYRDASGVCFSVEDDGVGISEAHAARVLEPFFSTKPQHSGTGLGLAVTKEIVAMHRGGLHVEPRTGRGTRAAFWIPIAEEASHG